MKNNNKGLILTIAALFTFLVFAGVSSRAKQKDSAALGGQLKETELTAEREKTEPLYIGLLQYASHPSLDAIAQGIVDTLKENGYTDGETMTLDFQNAQADQSNLNTMSTRFVSNNADLMIAIATPAALSLANASTEIPILLGAITDPENVGLVDTNEIPGGNITGVSDMTPVEQQLELIRVLQPEAQTLGLLYSSSEDNSILQGEMAADLANEYGFETITRTASSTNDVSQVAQQLVLEVDAIWVPNDNIIASAFPSVLEVTNEAKIPVYPAVDMMVAQGGLATLGLNQYQIGVETGKMAVELIKGHMNTASEPIRRAEETDLIINYETAELLNIKIPESLASEATDSKTLLKEE